jgi:plastocyanin
MASDVAWSGALASNLKRATAIAAALAILLALSAALSACGVGVSGMGDMEEMHQAMHGGGSQAPQTPVVSDSLEITVEIRDFDFFPRELTVSAGTAITWVNRGAAPHDATDESGEWTTGMLNQSESATVTFDSEGYYRYICTLHPNMRATLTVV